MKNERARLLRRMERLAGCRVNDAVKLAFLDGEQLGEIDGLDLGALKEFKRSGNGAVELKLVDRAAVLERLDRKSTRLNSSHITRSRMPSSA